jgi:hypothetical protein
MTTTPKRVQLPEAFLSVTGLGAPVDYFPLSKTNRLVVPIMAAVMVIASAITGGWGVDAGYGGFMRYGLAAVYNLVSLSRYFGIVHRRNRWPCMR